MEGSSSFAHGDGHFTFDDSASGEQNNTATNPLMVSPRPSLFSNGTPLPSPRSPHTAPREEPHSAMQPRHSYENEHAGQPTSPLVMTSMTPPLQQNPPAEPSSSFRSLAHRPRIPKVEKEFDDPNSPVAAQDSLPRRLSSTPSTLTRLFAVNAPTGESRSPSFNNAAESRPQPSDSDPASLTGHLLNQGLLGAKFSDITVHAFSNSYKLHRLLIARAPFFNTALSGLWLESRSDEITLHPADLDANIDRNCFELALKRLYGVPDEQSEATNAIGFFATGCWLEMPDIIDSSIENMLRCMTPENLTPLIKLVTSNYYGRAGDKILASAKAMLCRHGWKMAISNWDGVQADIVREIVGGDGFYVSGEWDRWVLATRILNRRLKRIAVETGLVQPGTKKAFDAPDVVKLMAIRFDNVYRRNAIRTASGLPDDVHRWVSVYTHPDVEPLLVLLDEGIHYMHLSYEHLQYIRKATDVYGLPMMPDKVVSDALWMQLDLRQRVLNATDDSLELGLSQVAQESQPVSSAVQESTMSMTKSPSSKGKQREPNAITPDGEEEMASDSWDGNGKPRKFWIPSIDCNIVMGGNSDPVVATSTTSSIARHASRLSGTLQPEDVQWAADFGAVAADTRPLAGSMRPTSAGGQPSNGIDNVPVSYTLFPPFRFAAEFQNPRLLKGKKRFYSKTIFYAGSLWNIYIQKVRSSKNPQLGVYLHRAKEREQNEALVNAAGLSQSSVDERIGMLEREMLLRHDRLTAQRRHRVAQAVDGDVGLEDDSSGSGEMESTLLRSDTRHLSQRPSVPLIRLSDRDHTKSRQNTSSRLPSMPSNRKRRSSSSPSPASKSDEHETSDDDESKADPELVRLSAPPPVHTLPPYVDARPKIKTYFRIYSPSKGGRMLSVYESVPSDFNFSQSWGWKSSTLMLDEGMAGDIQIGTLHDEGGPDSAIVGGGDRDGEELLKRPLSDGKLRFMVVIGNV